MFISNLKLFKKVKYGVGMLSWNGIRNDTPLNPLLFATTSCRMPWRHAVDMTWRRIPPGRTPVETRWISEKHLVEAYEFIRNELNHGRQAFVIYPLVKESEKLDLKSATDGARMGLPELKIGDLIGDYPLLKLARNDAFSIVQNDEHLGQEKNQHIRKMVIERFKGRLNLISIG